MSDVEQWRPVVGWVSDYEVSDAGRVRSTDRRVIRENGRPFTRVGRLLKSVPNPHGYPTVTLCSPGRRLSARVHRLVAEAFLPNPDGLLEINHIDGVKSNNTIANLEWSDRKANMRHLSSMGGVRSAKLTPADVREIRKALSLGVSANALGKRYGVDRMSIVGIRDGLTFSWVEDEQHD